MERDAGEAEHEDATHPPGTDRHKRFVWPLQTPTCQERDVRTFIPTVGVAAVMAPWSEGGGIAGQHDGGPGRRHPLRGPQHQS